jgi:flagellar basal body-associated protein FliL
MATKTAEPGAEAAAPTGGRLSNKLLLIVGLIVLFLMAQIGIICYFFLPPATTAVEPEARSKEPVAAVGTPAEDDSAELAEVEIGDNFRCTNSKAAANSVIHINLKLVALVASRDKIAFSEQVKLHEGRIRQAIIEVARSSSLENLNDPNLSTIKRLIKEKINKVLGKSYILEVVISDFTTMEQ